MKVYRIVAMSLITVLCMVGIICGLVFMDSGTHYMSYTPNPQIDTVYTTEKYYNGDAYTGIQQAVADVSYNVQAVEARLENLENDVSTVKSAVEGGFSQSLETVGILTIVLFSIALLISVGKLIAAIIDCVKSAAEKRRLREAAQQRQYAEQMQHMGMPQPTIYPNSDRL